MTVYASVSVVVVAITLYYHYWPCSFLIHIQKETKNDEANTKKKKKKRGCKVF